MSTLLILLVWSGSLVSHDSGASSTPPEKPSVDESRERSRSSRDRAIAYLLESQNPDGSWGGAANATFTDCWSNPETQRSWRVATTGLACMALLEAVDGDWGASDAAQRERGLDAVDRGLDTLIDGASLEQCEDWDLDNMWGYLYGLQGLARALANDRFGPEHRKHAAIRAAAGIHRDKLYRYQSPNGGWAYYADPSAAWRSEWATSFATAIAILAFLDARDVGIEIDAERLACAVRTVKRCRLPSGAYTYNVEAVPSPGWAEGIDRIKGSLGRIQLCNLALYRAGEGSIGLDEIEEGLEHFARYHKFLAVARARPIPHEAYYQNAGYFYYFGHYYAALVLRQLPPERRARFLEPIRRGITETQNEDGSMSDFIMHSYPRRYGAAYGALTLEWTLRE